MANGGACDRRSAIITFLGLLFLVIIVTWTLWNAQHSPLVKSTDPIIVDPPIVRKTTPHPRRPKPPNVGPDGYCRTTGCKKTAEFFLKMVAPDVDPCQDFFKFACGKYLKNNPLKRFDFAVGVTNDLNDRVTNAIIDFLDRVPSNKTATGADRKVYKTYKLCLDTKTTGFGPLRDILKAVGGSPFSGKPRPSLNDTIRLTGGDGIPFFAIDEYSAPESGALSLTFTRIAWKLPVQLVTKKLMVEELAKVLADDLGESDTPAKAAARQASADRYGDFLEKLEEIRTIGNDSFKRITHDEAAELYPNLHMKTLIKNRYQGRAPGAFYVEYLRFFEELNRLIGEYPEVAVEAVIAELVLDRIHEIGEKYEEINKKWLSLKTEIKTYCGGKMLEYHPRWTDAVAMERVYKQRDLDSVPKLMHKVREAFYEIIRESPWADPPTQDVAVGKIKNVTMHIGQDVETWPRRQVEAYYKNYTPAEAPTWAAFREKRKRWTGFKNFSGALVKTHVVVNAYNAYHTIRILWGIMGPPFYTADAALELKYGGVGFIIGHELGHTIDPNNIRRARPVLIGEEDEQQFWEQVECIQHQYEKETLPMNSMNHTFNQPGDLTHGETVADNVGLRSSFRAYRKERKRLYGKLEPKLPGLDRYTPDQVYFIAAAMFWCGEMSDQRLTQYLENAHPPGVFRVNEMMKNSMEFAQAYKCPLNSPMNPAKKCRVWRHKKRH